MDLVHLECFVALAEDLHFGRAAARLHIGVPGLSKRIADLERELDLRLFDRSSRRVALTGPGAALLEQARRALAEVKALRDMARDAASGAVGAMRVAYSPGNGEMMTLLVRHLHEEMPSVSFVPEMLTSMRINESVLRGDASVGIVRVPPDHGLERLQLTSTPISRVVMPTAHRLATRDSLGFEDLAGETIIAPSPALTGGSHASTPPTTAEHGPGIRHVDVTSEGELLDLVSAGFGICLLGDGTVRRNPRYDLVARPLRVPSGYTHDYLVWRSDDESPITRRVVEVAQTLLPEFVKLAG